MLTVGWALQVEVGAVGWALQVEVGAVGWALQGPSSPAWPLPHNLALLSLRRECLYREKLALHRSRTGSIEAYTVTRKLSQSDDSTEAPQTTCRCVGDLLVHR